MAIPLDSRPAEKVTLTGRVGLQRLGIQRAPVLFSIREYTGLIEFHVWFSLQNSVDMSNTIFRNQSGACKREKASVRYQLHGL